MTDFISFDEGANYELDSGITGTVYFLLSTRGVDAGTALTAGQTLGGGTLGEITGTGYTRKSQTAPAAASRAKAFAAMSWATGSATDWPASVRSIVLVTSADNTGKAICAWNLQPGGTPRDLSTANTTEQVTPTLSV